jgi:hypothetical protein
MIESKETQKERKQMENKIREILIDNLSIEFSRWIESELIDSDFYVVDILKRIRRHIEVGESNWDDVRKEKILNDRPAMKWHTFLDDELRDLDQELTNEINKRNL